jgi:cell wall-associated NlpC family hydrolase
MSGLDRRLHAYRDDLADVRLKGRVEAARFVDGVAAHCVLPVVPVMREPSERSMQLTQALLGEDVLVFERRDGWAFVQLRDDGYVGYMAAAALADGFGKATHRVRVPLSHLYPSASIKTQPALAVPLMARVEVTSITGDFATLADGRFATVAHVAAVAMTEVDFVSVAERFLHVPYLWGGKTALGIDCSGLVQVALACCGVACPRDSDMQEKDLGSAISLRDVVRGDLVFWKGHVGLMRDATTLLHANGHHMQVVSEPLAVAVARIAAKGSAVTAVKRLQ